MYEYNFWDDRTHEFNESNYCPIVAGYCIHDEADCLECEERKEFERYYNSGE